MLRFCSFFFYLLDYADIFRFPLTLTFNKLEKTSTYTGKLTTLGIIIFLMYSFIVSDLVNKKNAQTLSQDLMQLRRPSMLLSKQNFTMALGIADSNNVFITDETIFSFIFYVYHYNSTSQIVNQTTYILKPCNQENFIENPNEFSTLGLRGTFCLPVDEVKLGGYWDEEVIDYFWIELRTCQNSSSSNITCKSNEEIIFTLKYNFIDIYMTNHNIDSANYDSPISRNLKIFYQLIDTALLKSLNLYIKHSLIETDDGFFFENLKIIESFLHGDMENDVSLNQNTDNLLYVLNIYSSNLQNTVVRNYQKIQTLLAQLGGICNFLFLFGFMLSKFENHYNLISFISNELYIFPKIQKKPDADSIIQSDILGSKKLSIFKSERNRKKKTKKSNQKDEIHSNENKNYNDMSVKKEINLSKFNVSYSHNLIKDFSMSDSVKETANQDINKITLNESNKISLNKIPLSARYPDESDQKSIFKMIHLGSIESNIINNENNFYRAEKYKADPKFFEEHDISVNFHENNNTINNSPSDIKPRPSNKKNEILTNSQKVSLSPASKKCWQDRLKTVLKVRSPSKQSIGMASSENLMMSQNLEHYQKLKKKENFFSVGFGGFMKILFKKKMNCIFKRLTKKETLFEKGENQIADELDILNILKKLQDIEKLKRILLSEEQLYFFNLLSKPMIIPEEAKLRRNSTYEVIHDQRFKFSAKDDKYFEKEKLRDIYKNLKERSEGSEIDKRIMKLLDEDVKCFLHNENFMQ